MRAGLVIVAALLLSMRAGAATLMQWEPPADNTFGITAQRLAVVVNDDDPYSIGASAYYAAKRHVPSRNVIHVHLPLQSDLSAREFETLRTRVIEATPTNVQAFLLAWVQPYRVDCMSITSAFAFGFDTAYCAKGCVQTKTSTYFDSYTRLPADSLGIFPTMLLAAPDVDEAKSLIDRGIRADGSHPTGTAYLVSTDDAARNVRARYFPAAQAISRGIHSVLTRVGTMRHRNDILAYFVGARTVDDIATNHYLPGAVADHLTSTGGDLLHTHQMSSLRWIEAGATGSYGTVVEPCAFTQKFPDPAVFLKYYLKGETLLEAYWKSVQMPGQGVFIGEPLARPYG